MRSILSGGFWGLFLAALGLGFASEVSEPPVVMASDTTAVTDMATAPADIAVMDPQDEADDTLVAADAMQADLTQAPQPAPDAVDQAASPLAKDPPNAAAEVAVPVPAGVATTETDTETQAADSDAITSEGTTGTDTQVAVQEADAPAVAADIATDTKAPDATVANEVATDISEGAAGTAVATAAEPVTSVADETPPVANTPPTVSTATSDVPIPEVGNQNPPAVTENLADFIDRMVMPDGSAPPTAAELDPNMLTDPAPRAPLAVVDGGTPDAPTADTTAVDVPIAEVADVPTPAPARVADASTADDLPTAEVTSAEQPSAPQQTVTVNTPVVLDETDSTQGAETQVAAAAPATGAVRINRPTAQTADVPTPTEVADDALSEEIATDAPAHLRYAAPFDNPNDLPLMSIVLLDDGTVPGIFDMVTDIGFPATVVLDAGAALVGTRMTAYRAGGVELGLKAALPENPTPSDVEVTFEAAFGAVPEAVALFVDERDGGKASRDVSSQMVKILADRGRGFVSLQDGLGNSVRDATQANVPAVAVARDLDKSVAAPSDLNRILDQAAFKARQSGENVLVARITPELLTGLKAWAEKVDRDQLLLAPVSAMFSEVDAAQ